MPQLTKLGTRGTSVKWDSDGSFSVVYHYTPVVTVKANGTIILDHGGWRSYTTKVRMNQASNQFGLGFSVYQKDFDWFVQVNGETIPFDGRELTIRSGSN